MADTKISDLTAATTPLTGTELVPIVQGAETRRVAVSALGTPLDLSLAYSIAVTYRPLSLYGG